MTPPATPGDGATLARIGGVDLPLVLHVRVVTNIGGGPDKTILRSPKWADHDRVRMAAAYIHPRNDPGIGLLRIQAEQQGCPFIELPERGPIDPRTVRALVNLCKRRNVAVWHGHDHKSNALGLLVRQFHPMKLVTTAHGWTRETWRNRLYCNVDRWCLRRYDQVVAVSRDLYDQLLHDGLDRKRLWHIPNAIDLTEYERSQDRSAARDRLDIADDEFVLGVVARLSDEKGVDRAVRATRALVEKYPDVRLHIIGDGPAFEPLRALAIEQHVAPQVRFWGWQTPTQRFYEAMDTLLVPSRTEGLPNVALEAMAMCVPVAATDVGGVSKLLQRGRCGVLLNGDECAWPSEIEPLIVSAERRAELARRARRRIEEHYSFVARMERMMRVYDRVLSIGKSTRESRRAA